MPANLSHIHLIRLFLAFALGLLLTTAPAMALDASSIDLPPCDASAPGKTSGLSLGIVQPGAAPTVLEYAARLTLQAPQGISICSESWSDVLPRWAPWAKALERGYGFALFLLALVTVVGLLYWKTPKHWWQRTTLVSVLSIGGLGWLLGIGLLAAFHGLGGHKLFYGTVVSLHLPQDANIVWLDVANARELEAQLAQRQLLPATAPETRSKFESPAAASNSASVEPIGDYRTTHRLNLREAPGTAAARIAIIAQGETLTYDGKREGDWWHMRTRAGQVGWTSSLWLRRPDELR